MNIFSCEILEDTDAIRDFNKTAKTVQRLKQGPNSGTPFKQRSFIAMDGEGVTFDESQIQSYVLFGASNGTWTKSIQSPELRTAEILEFILNLPADTIPVMYAFNYDVSMLTIDMEDRELFQLKEDDTWASYGKYSLKWLPGKWLEIKDGYRYKKVFDMFSFFGCAFVKACEQYLGDDPELAEVIEGKKQRDVFEYEEMETLIKPYMTKELHLMVKLANRLRELLSTIDVNPTSWHGPGAIASSLMRQHKIKDYRVEPDDYIRTASQYAYYGGRFEAFKTGLYEKPVYQYDICSAYPYALTKLPSFTGEYFIDTTPSDTLQPSDWSLCRVAYYDIDTGRTGINPLAHRAPNGAILFPATNETWVWGVEYKAAKRYRPDTLHLRAVVTLEDTGERPFEFIGEMYENRRRWKSEGNPAQLAAKLGMNSIYGRLAQRVGWDQEKIEAPRSHQLSWAGFTTATCRAMIMDAIAQAPDRIIAVETDGIFSEVPLDLPIGKALGQWEREEYLGIMYIQSGIYFTRDLDGDWSKGKTRGFKPNRTNLDVAMNALPTLSPLEYDSHRFHGLTGYIAKPTLRGWFDHPHIVRWGGNGKRLHLAKHCTGCATGSNWHETCWRATISPISQKHPLPWVDAAALGTTHDTNSAEGIAGVPQDV